MLKYITSSMLLLTLACTPKLSVKPSEYAHKPPVQEFEPFACLEKDTIEFHPRDFIGDVEFKDKSFAVICDYETIKSLACDEAKKMGGNILVITEHKLPDQWSTCHRIKGKVYRILDPEKFETEILWHAKRRLNPGDFRGTVVNRPFLAATSSSFRYFTSVQPFSKQMDVTVQTFFECRMSYFKPAATDTATLHHEQLHFDITEIYARKLVEKMQHEPVTTQTVNMTFQRLIKEIAIEWRLKQDEYDSEVYKDRNKMSKWQQWVQEQLNASDQYASKKFKINIR